MIGKFALWPAVFYDRPIRATIFEGGAVNRAMQAIRERKRIQVTAVVALAAIVVGGLAWGLSGSGPVNSSPAAAPAATTPVRVSTSASAAVTATETPSPTPTTAAPSPTATVAPRAVVTSSRPRTSPTTAKPRTSPTAPTVSLEVCEEDFQAQGVSQQWSADGKTDQYTAQVTLWKGASSCPVTIIATASLLGQVKATRTYTTELSRSGDITATFDFTGVGCMDEVMYTVGIQGSHGALLPGSVPSLCNGSNDG